MPQVIFTQNKRISIKYNQTILDAARKGRVILKHRCGGKASCGTCKIKLDWQGGQAQKASEPNDKEKRLLGSQLDEGFRLACQTKVYQDIQVEIPEDPLKAFIQKQIEQQKRT